MIARSCFVTLQHHIVRLTRMMAILVLCLASISACAASDPAFDIVQQALQNADGNPGAAYRVLEENLSKVEDKAVIPLLLTYFEETKQRGEYSPGILAIIALYLEEISGIESHVTVNIAGPLYTRDKEWKEDVAQWQTWWNTNKDYIYWDEQAQALKVKPH